MSALNAPIQLRQWLHNACGAGWQPLDTVLSSGSCSISSFRHTVELANSPAQRLKVLELEEQTMWLFVGLEPEEGDRFSIRVQLRSAEPEAILPTRVRLALLSDSGDIVQAVAARDQDNGIQLKRFRCSMGTRFVLQVSLTSVNFVEKFIV